MAESAVWFYQRKTMFNPVDEGPITEAELKQLASSGKFGLDTLIRSPQKTKNNWVPVAKFAPLVSLINKYQEEVAAEKSRIAEERKQEAEQKAVARRAAKTQLEIPTVQQQPNFPVQTAPQVQAAPVHVNVSSQKQSSNSLGIASMVIGIVALFVCWLPFVGLGLSGIGLLLGIGGLAMAVVRKGTGVGYGIAGSAISMVGVAAGGFYLLFLAGLSKGMSDFAEEFEKEMAKQERNAVVANNAQTADPVLVDRGDVEETPTDSPASQADEFLPYTESLKLGDVEIKISKVSIEKIPLKTFSGTTTSKDDLLYIQFEVTNTSPNKKINFKSWSKLSFLTAGSLEDNFGNTYKGINFGISELADVDNESSLYPNKSVKDAIVFELPLDTVEFLKLTLNGDSVGQQGKYRFKIPMTAVSR